jgi:ankyrin repeat protein
MIWHRSPILEEAIQDGKITIAERLLESGADRNAADIIGQTPLMVAVQGRNYDAIYMLVNFGANVNMCDSYGRTALSLARDASDSVSVSILIRAGARK